ncbi:hypothetical protein PsorP6_009611 [Peronosclerospora sorghi]|uniref:Uncharacterized protein n=1 Tax=Peronosclerospora sorghi TaxID=230839 RepID=A0ACC0VZI8_9STRA|nr:hypothetical protein PsorP6_009611 [Peronosclerospora sorghi]
MLGSSRAKWKLKGEAINRLTSTASKEADIALVILDRSVANLRFFARGKRGVLYAGEMRSDNKPVVAKLAADATSVRSVTQEARWLRLMSRMTIGPKVIDAGNGWFLCERLEGENVIEFLGLDNKVATPTNAMLIIREMLCLVRSVMALR